MRHSVRRRRSTTCVRRCGRPSGMPAATLLQQLHSRHQRCRSVDSRRPALSSRAASHTPTCWEFTAAAPRARQSSATWPACSPDSLSSSTATPLGPTSVIQSVQPWILNLIYCSRRWAVGLSANSVKSFLDFWSNRLTDRHWNKKHDSVAEGNYFCRETDWNICSTIWQYRVLSAVQYSYMLQSCSLCVYVHI